MFKIHLVFICFLRMSENDVFRTSGPRSGADQFFPGAHIIYYKYCYTDILVVGLPLFMVDFPWSCSSLPRDTPPLQRELLRLIPKSCPSPRDAIEHPRDTEDARVQFSTARTTAMTLKQQLEYDARHNDQRPSSWKTSQPRLTDAASANAAGDEAGGETMKSKPRMQRG